MPLAIEELGLSGYATIQTVEDCGPIARGDGSVITGRFTTSRVNVIVRLTVTGPDGTTEVLEGTTVHPIWSVDRNDWIQLSELQEGERLQATDGIATVLSIAIVSTNVPVYNIEVHGEHVYQVGELGVLVHNACEEVLQSLGRGEVAAGFMTRGGKLLAASKTLGHEALALTVSNLTHMADNGQAIAFTVGKNLDDIIMVFGSGRFPVPGGLTDAMKNMIRNLVQ